MEYSSPVANFLTQFAYKNMSVVLTHAFLIDIPFEVFSIISFAFDSLKIIPNCVGTAYLVFFFCDQKSIG